MPFNNLKMPPDFTGSILMQQRKVMIYELLTTDWVGYIINRKFTTGLHDHLVKRLLVMMNSLEKHFTIKEQMKKWPGDRIRPLLHFVNLETVFNPGHLPSKPILKGPALRM